MSDGVFGLNNSRLAKKMKRNSLRSVACLGVVLVLYGLFGIGFCTGEDKLFRMKVGGVHDFKGNHNSAEIESLARFAIQEYNKKHNVVLEFSRVLKAKDQVVAGKIYHLTFEAVEGGNKKIYEAKVWVKPWMNFKQLQEFKQVHDISSFTTSDLDVKKGH
ncbi:hypothetical protein L6164_034254 [Bauhinia variegata]|uniref:Uncharacterized protein n=1 Tax=Bauhinia variegata TaxID=167791 RepID=A0ACB9KV27_BAUVA|nr:hypothetical protein L6164_034254 [Bauhinia variegata]